MISYQEDPNWTGTQIKPDVVSRGTPVPKILTTDEMRKPPEPKTVVVKDVTAVIPKGPGEQFSISELFGELPKGARTERSLELIDWVKKLFSDKK